MHWSLDEYVLLATGVLFGAALLVGRSTRVNLSRMSYVVFAVAATVCVVAAVALATVVDVWFPPVLLLLPAVPLVIIVALLRDASARPETVQGDVARRSTEIECVPSGDPSTNQVFPARLAPPQPVVPARDSRLSASERFGENAAARARAHNPHTSAGELADLAYGHPSLRAAVAANPATPAAVLEWLAKCGDPAVTAAIAARGLSSSLRASAMRPPTSV